MAWTLQCRCIMKKTIWCLITVILFSQLTFAEVDYRETDKESHLYASGYISMISYGAFRSKRFGKISSSVISFSLTMLIGHLKESSDPFYDKEDMEANALGASAGIIIPLSFTF